MIRRMTAADAELAARLDCAAFSRSWDEREFLNELRKDYAYYCVVERDGEPAGYAGIWCVYETAELARIGVLPNMRRRGAAAELMAHITDFAVRAGCERMLLEVRESNRAARALYEKFGFVEISVRRGYYDGTEDGIIMERRFQV